MGVVRLTTGQGDADKDLQQASSQSQLLLGQAGKLLQV
jgi:hypothetical protein